MAEEKRKQEEEEKAQQIAKQQQERKAVMKMSREAQQPVVPVEEPVAPTPVPLPKKISSEVRTWSSEIHMHGVQCAIWARDRTLRGTNDGQKIRQRPSLCCLCLQKDLI
jgi:hypothetical protein